MFTLLFGVYLLCPIRTTFDSKLVSPTVVSILREGNIDLDEFGPAYGNVTHGLWLQKGHAYNIYPVGVSLAVLPVYGAAQIFTTLFPWKQASWRHRFESGSAFNPDEWDNTERLTASLMVALAGLVMFEIFSRRVNFPKALLLTFIFAFCTSALSTASRALWQHGPSMLFLALALFVFTRDTPSRRWMAGGGFFIAMAYVMRPTNALSVVIFSAWVLLRHRRFAAWYFLGAAAVALPWVTLNYHLYDHLLPPYYRQSGFFSPDSHFGEALVGHLLAPSRGLFVYTPVFLFSAVGLWRDLKAHKQFSLHVALGVIIVLHWIVVSSFAVWWAGHSYGPRFFTDLTPYFVFLLIPVVDQLKWKTGGDRRFTGMFAAGVAVSLIIHLAGATDSRVYQWNSWPVNVDLEPSRVWDWHDCQVGRIFKRGHVT